MNNELVNKVNNIIEASGLVGRKHFMKQAGDPVSNICVDGFRKFVLSDGSTDAERAEVAVSGYVADNTRLRNHQLVMDKGLLRFVRNFIKYALGTDTLRADDFNSGFGPGETFTSHKGLTTVFAKLSRRFGRQRWTCTREAFPHVVCLLRQNHVFYGEFLRVCRENLESNKDFGPALMSDVSDDKLFALFCRQHIAFVPGNRVETVPKNAAQDRAIGIEPMMNLLYQRQLGKLLRRSLRRVGNDLKYGQDRHQLLIKSTMVSTLDLASASNSNAMELVRLVFPAWFVNHVEASRSPCSRLPQGGWVNLHMVSSMGNGFTFELMTLILLAICRYFDRKASVYGDDIIVSQSASYAVIQAIEGAGYTLNAEKSFLYGIFTRESCGAYFHSDTLITRFDIKNCVHIGDCILTYNKVRRMYDFLGKVQASHDDVYRLLRKLRKKLASALEEVVPYGPVLAIDSLSKDEVKDALGLYLETPDFKQGLVTDYRQLHANLIASDLHLGPTYAIETYVFAPTKRELNEVWPEFGFAALWAALVGQGVPNISTRGNGRRCKSYVIISEGRILGIFRSVKKEKIAQYINKLIADRV